MRILITRPRADSEALAARLAAAGIDGVVAPMLEVLLREGPPLDLAGVQAVLATSANGARAFAARSDRRDLPLLAVGEATAAAARAAGFTDVLAAEGDSEQLAELARDRLEAGAGTVLHAAGAHTAGDLAGALAAAGFDCRREVLYEAVAAEALPGEAARALADGTLDGVALFSPRTARTFVALARAAGHQAALAGLTAYCLSEAVAGAAERALWRRVVVAVRANADSLIELIRADLPARQAPPGVAARAGGGWRAPVLAAAVAAVVSVLVVLGLASWLAPAPAPAEAPPDPRIGSLEQRLDDLARRVDSRFAALPPAAAPAAVEALAGDLAARERALRADLARSRDAAADLAQRLDALETRIAALSDRMAQADTGGQARRAGALLIGLGQLRAAIADARPYQGELDALSTLAAGESALQPALAGLAAAAPAGVETEAELGARFPAVAVAALKEGAGTADDGWLGHALAELRSLVTIRRVGADVAGTDADAVLARAQAHIEAGDLAAAVAALAALRPVPAPLAAWLAEARALLDARAALDALTVLIVAHAEASEPPAP
ncbi:MAG TPA: uroporphyrinogen-III synthase [Alphaproteobacteria bacterium]